MIFNSTVAHLADSFMGLPDADAIGKTWTGVNTNLLENKEVLRPSEKCVFIFSCASDSLILSPPSQ
jgi:hypothetical protein